MSQVQLKNKGGWESMGCLEHCTLIIKSGKKKTFLWVLSGHRPCGSCSGVGGKWHLSSLCEDRMWEGVRQAGGDQLRSFIAYTYRWIGGCSFDAQPQWPSEYFIPTWALPLGGLSGGSKPWHLSWGQAAYCRCETKFTVLWADTCFQRRDSDPHKDSLVPSCSFRLWVNLLSSPKEGWGGVSPHVETRGQGKEVHL